MIIVCPFCGSRNIAKNSSAIIGFANFISATWPITIRAKQCMQCGKNFDIEAYYGFAEPLNKINLLV